MIQLLQVVHLGIQKLMAEKNSLMSADDQDGTQGVKFLIEMCLGWITSWFVSSNLAQCERCTLIS